ncbi:sensor histidine kinase [Aeromicrobium stalagmiti]|uniref:sensor histidine kinase n=1 Tax=Aeromicrobium stalagmiti TaxID=2738988 RepID=UPI0015685CB2|nr:sensor histidine kinase [Aeromicrobium stalagmiti]
MRDRSELLRRLDSAWLDVLLVAVLIFVPLVLLGVQGDDIFLLDIALLAPLALRRRATVASFTLICLGLLVQVASEPGPRYGDVALLLGLYAIAAYGPVWAVWAGLATGFLGAVIASFQWSNGVYDINTLFFAFITLATMVFAAWLLGYLARTRRAYVASLEDRAAQLERDAAQQTQIATAAERARIAREMHDVVAHSLSVMVVQADGALYAAQKRPEQALETLRTISATGRSSLTEMRKLLGLLRDEDSNPALAPMPGARDIPELVQQLRDSGLTIDLQVAGPLDGLDAATGLTAYRIVQEALTNTLKHAGPEVSASVDVQVTADAVQVQVDDDGRGAATADDGQGHGILGIRERIAVHAGEVEAGPRPGGGFRVRAVVPVVTS